MTISKFPLVFFESEKEIVFMVISPTFNMNDNMIFIREACTLPCFEIEG